MPRSSLASLPTTSSSPTRFGNTGWQLLDLLLAPALQLEGIKKIIQVLEEKRKVAWCGPDKAGRDEEEPVVSLRDATNCWRRFKFPLKFPQSRHKNYYSASKLWLQSILLDKGWGVDLLVLHPQGSAGWKQSDGEHGQKNYMFSYYFLFNLLFLFMDIFCISVYNSLTV